MTAEKTEQQPQTNGYNLFTCQLCSAPSMSPSEFSTHLKDVHQLDSSGLAVFASRRGYRLVRMEPVDHEPFDIEELINRDILSSMDTRTDADGPQTDMVLPLHSAADTLQLDRTRAAVIEVLVLAGWEVGAIRSTLKGANDDIGDEIASVRERLGMQAPPVRSFVAREHREGQLIEREITIRGASRSLAPDLPRKRPDSPIENRGVCS